MVRDNNIISSKKKGCNVVGRRVWFADKGIYWTVSSGIVLAVLPLPCGPLAHCSVFSLSSLHLPMASAC